MASVASVVSYAVPTQAGELTEWRYDSQTRSLSVVLPNTVAPSISVLTPTQLLLELPDTQMGDVMEQTVGDGVVESIVLEQATPDTVWMVVEFAAGSVLADVQNATQTALADEDLRQWQIRPALESSLTTLNAVANAVANDPFEVIGNATIAGADSLRPPTMQIAQADDFPDLPMLEPAIPVGESVSVPPIDSSVEQSIPVQPESVQISVSQPPEQMEANQPLGEVSPTVETDPVVIPVVSDSGPLESDSLVAVREEAEEVAADEEAADEEAADEIAADEIAIGEVAVETAVVDEAVVADDGVPSEPPFIREVGNIETPIAPVDSAAIANSDRLPALEPAAIEPVPAVDVPAVNLPAMDNPATEDLLPSVRPRRVNRWPEPVPFGQPLPETPYGG